MQKQVLFILSLVIFSCGLSTMELQEEVKMDIIETLKDDPDFLGVQVVDLSLIHKGGNEYIGVLNVIEPNSFAEAWNTLLQKDLLNENGIEAEYDVEVIYDGYSFMWEITEIE